MDNIDNISVAQTSGARRTASGRLEHFTATLTTLNASFEDFELKITKITLNTSTKIISLLIIEFKGLCREQDENIDKLKGAGLIDNAEIRVLLQKGMDARIRILNKLKQILKQVKDAGFKKRAVVHLLALIVKTKQSIDKAGLKGSGKLADLVRDIYNEFGGLFSAGDQIHSIQLLDRGNNSGRNKKDDKGGSLRGLSLSLLAVLNKHNLREEVAEIFRELIEYEKQLMKDAEKRKQKELLAAKKLENKKIEAKEKRTALKEKIARAPL